MLVGREAEAEAGKSRKSFNGCDCHSAKGLSVPIQAPPLSRTKVESVSKTVLPGEPIVPVFEPLTVR